MFDVQRQLTSKRNEEEKYRAEKNDLEVRISGYDRKIGSLKSIIQKVVNRRTQLLADPDHFANSMKVGRDLASQEYKYTNKLEGWFLNTICQNCFGDAFWLFLFLYG